MFGVRLIAGLLGKLRFFAASAVLLAALGLGLGLVAPEEYIYQGTVGIGLLYPKEPVESPMLVSMRMVEAGLSVVDYDLKRGRIQTHVRPGGHRKSLGAIIDLTVRAKTASLAISMFDKAVARTLQTHQQARAFEEQINQDHVESSRVRAALLRAKASDEGALLSSSNEGLFIARKDVSSVQALALPFQTPPTLLLRRDIEPVRRLSRVIVYGVTGFLAGGILALFWVLSLILMRETENDLGQASLAGAYAFCASNTRLIFSSAVVLSLLSLAITARKMDQSIARTTLQMAHVAPYGGFRDLDSMKIEFKNLAEHLIEKKCGDSCPMEIDIYSIRAALTPYSRTDIIQFRGKGRDRALIASTLDETAKQFVHRQKQDYQNARRIQNEKIEELAGDIARLSALDEQLVDQSALIGFIREQTKHRRYLNPARTYPARILVPVHFERSQRLQFTVIAAVLGSIAGAALGVLMALLLAGWRLHRAN